MPSRGRAGRRWSSPSSSTSFPGCAARASPCPGRPAAASRAVRASGRADRARPRSSWTAAGSATACPASAGRSATWPPPGRPSGPRATATRCPPSPSPATPTPASPHCSTSSPARTRWCRTNCSPPWTRRCGARRPRTGGSTPSRTRLVSSGTCPTNSWRRSVPPWRRWARRTSSSTWLTPRTRTPRARATSRRARTCRGGSTRGWPRSWTVSTPAEADTTTTPDAVTSAASVDVLRHAVAAIGGVEREGQHRMALAASRTIEAGGVLLAQAGTGTGKSLAYLAACMTDAVLAGRTVVISTATLALQRQIMLKDAPTVAASLAALHGQEPRVALLKGWHNYVCKHKVAGGYPDEDEPTLFSVDASSTRPAESPRSALGVQVTQVRAWAGETETGDRDDMVPGVGDRAWRQVSVTKLECLGAACPVRDECFAEAARARSREADVVVTNHAMLGIAAGGSPGVLPEHDVLVIDEAHDLVSRVTSAATVELSATAVERSGRAAGRHAKSAVAGLQRAAIALRGALDAAPDGRLT